MKFRPLATSACLAVLISLTGTRSLAQTTVATDPVGFTTVTVPAAASATSPSRAVISNPLQSAPVQVGVLSSVTASTLSDSTANWAAGQFSSSPYLVKITSGTNTGRFFLITANSSNQLTVATLGADLTQIASAGDRYRVFAAQTLGSLFGSTSVSFKTNDAASQADNVLVWNGTSWDTYYNDSTGWYKVGDFAEQSSTIIYPDEGMFVVRRDTTPLTLTFLGNVPTTAESSYIPGNGNTLVSQRFPVDVTLGSLNIQQLPGWVSGEAASSVDNVLLWNGSAWDTYYYDNTGPNWAKVGSFAAQDSAVIPQGSAFLVHRKQGSTAPNTYLRSNLPYTLN